MKRLVVAGVLALAVLTASQQQASAWCRCNMSFGFNWTIEGGGNSLLWGLYQSSPGPCCGSPGCVFGAVPFGANWNCAAPGYAAPVYAGLPNYGAPAPVQPKPTPTTTPQQPVSTSVNPVSYYAPASYGSYYPYNNYNSGQVPSYWYGR